VQRRDLQGETTLEGIQLDPIDLVGLGVHGEALDVFTNFHQVLVEHRQGAEQIFGILAFHRFHAAQSFADLADDLEEGVQVTGGLLPADLNIQPGWHSPDGAEDAGLLGIGAEGFAFAQFQQEIVQRSEISRHFVVKAESAVCGFGDKFVELCQV